MSLPGAALPSGENQALGSMSYSKIQNCFLLYFQKYMAAIRYQFTHFPTDSA